MTPSLVGRLLSPPSRVELVARARKQAPLSAAEFQVTLASLRTSARRHWRREISQHEGNFVEISIRRFAAEAVVALERAEPSIRAEWCRDAVALDEEMLLATTAVRLRRPSAATDNAQVLTEFLTGRYGERAPDLLPKAIEALLAFGGPAETRTPVEAVLQACDMAAVKKGATAVGRPEGRAWTKKKWEDEYRKADAELAKTGTRPTDHSLATEMDLPYGTFRDYKNEYGVPD